MSWDLLGRFFVSGRGHALAAASSLAWKLPGGTNLRKTVPSGNLQIAKLSVGACPVRIFLKAANCRFHYRAFQLCSLRSNCYGVTDASRITFT
jgi:hypothetical protein